MIFNNKRPHTKYIVIHCSNTPNNKFINATDIDTQHRKRGYFSNGFHKVILRDGTVEDGRGIHHSGAHIERHKEVKNNNSISICLVGTDEFTEEQYESLRITVKEILKMFPNLIVYGHNELTKHKCPNFIVAEKLGN